MKKILSLGIVFLLINIVYAYYPGQTIIIPASYSVDGIPTLANATISIDFPNGTNSVTTANMTSNTSGYFYYTYTFDSSATGPYFVKVEFFNSTNHTQGISTDLFDVQIDQTSKLNQLSSSIAAIPTSKASFYAQIGGLTCEQAYPTRTTCLFNNNSLCKQGCLSGYYCDSKLYCQKNVTTINKKSVELFKGWYSQYQRFSYSKLNNKYFTLWNLLNPEWIIPFWIVLLSIIITLYNKKEAEKDKGSVY